MALFALVPMLTAVRAGRWLDAVGPRKPLAAGSALLAAGAVLPALFPYAVADVAPLLVAGCLIGTGSMLIQQTTIHLVGERADPGRRAADFSWLALGASVAGLAGPVASGVLIDFVGHRAAFATQGTIILSVEEGSYYHLVAYNPQSLPYTRISIGAWNDITPATSPDGMSLAFSSNRSGQWDLYSIDLLSGEVTRLTDTPEYDAAPSWSPDGQWIVYESYVSETLAPESGEGGPSTPTPTMHRQPQRAGRAWSCSFSPYSAVPRSWNLSD